MITEFSKDVLQKMDVDGDGNRKYYVYGLLDPSTFRPFYVGKGCGNRVFKHAKNAIKMKDNEDEASLKIATIQSIIEKRKEVITLIYRWGLTEDEAFQVESTLIDIFPELTNIQEGHDSDRGFISTEDLQNALSCGVYDEPSQDYVIIKTLPEFVESRGSLYEATRRFWHAKLEKAQEYKFVLSVVRGVVQEVFEVERWFTSPTKPPRIEFEGTPTKNAEMRALIGKMIPEDYRKKGLASPFLYKKQ